MPDLIGARQITKVFVQPDFSKSNHGTFERERIAQNTLFVGLSDFGPDLDNLVSAFPSPDLSNVLSWSIGLDGKQVYISEHEKYAHVTYFFNGGYTDPIAGEKRVKISSEEIYTYADKPEMNSGQITEEIVRHLESGEFLFVCANYPNADMLGHTGDFESTKEAIRFLDTEVQKVVDSVRELGGICIITADHGNAEEMIDCETGEMMTEHTDNPVPFILVSDIVNLKLRTSGMLSDIAPTILDLYGIDKPIEMTGESLINRPVPKK